MVSQLMILVLVGVEEANSHQLPAVAPAIANHRKLNRLTNVPRIYHAILVDKNVCSVIGV